MIHGNLRIVHVRWFQGSVGVQMGVVKCVDTVTNEVKYYIGTGKVNVFDFEPPATQEIDIINIIDWGSKFVGKEFEDFFKDIVDYPVYEEKPKNTDPDRNIKSGISGTIKH